MKKKLLLVGATDPSGAGLQADWRVCSQLGTQACSVVTAVTAQNHAQVNDTGVLPPARVRAQLRAVDWSCIAAIKIGMLGNAEIIEVLLEYLPGGIPLVLDPVLAASSGGRLLDDAGRRILIDRLLPLTSLITPNLGEARVLTDTDNSASPPVASLAARLRTLGADAVLITGADHDPDTSAISDYYASSDHQAWLKGRRWKQRQNVRGTGCSLATTIAALLAMGHPLSEAVVLGKSIINAAIGAAVEDGAAWQLQHIGWPERETQLPQWCEHPDSVKGDNHFPDCGSRRLGIYPVVDSLEWIKRLVPLGVETIQLRIKQADPAQLEQQIAGAVSFCRNYPVRLFINDYWQLAIRYRAYGVHLGQEDLAEADLEQISRAGLRLGISTHCYREVARALAVKPSYLALGPIFATDSKQMPWIPQGVDAVRQWCALLDSERPLVAIGGIDLARARELATTGVGSVAMISAITRAPDPEQATRELLALWQPTATGRAECR